MLTRLRPRLSFFRKQLLVIISINVISLAIAAVLLYVNFVSDSRKNLVEVVHSKVVLLSSASTSAILFDDKDAANAVLTSLDVDTSIRFAQIFSADKSLFAQYKKPGQQIDIALSEVLNSPYFKDEVLYICEPILLQQEIVGYLLISAGTDKLQHQEKRYALIVLLVFCFSVFLAYVLNWRMQKRFNAPLNKLIKLVQEVANKRSYHKRLHTESDDELGQLFYGVNSMLNTIQKHERQLKDDSERLESLVQLRTEELFNKANYDGLTKLPNRHLLNDRINHAIESASRTNGKLVLMFLDLNRFKIINDSLGHGMGDKLLIKVSARLSELLRQSDSLARWGGDEFVILLEQITDHAHTEKLAQKIISALNEPVEIDEHQLHVSASIGISVYPDDGKDTATLIKHADISMYRAKELGMGKYVFFHKDMLEYAANYLSFETDIRRAINENEFSLMYQPQISTQTKEMMGVEALIRWNDKGKMVMPNDFLAHAEDLGVMTQISQWVLNEACRQVKQWQNMGLNIPKVAVNLPVSSIMHPHIIRYIKQALNSAELNPTCLEIEITETNFISSTDYTISVLRELRALGIRVSIDDFGTGYSCMSYLQNLPIDTLKIDGSFVRNLGKNKAANGIVQSIVTLGKSLNLNLIAECAETQEQVNALEMLECDVIQGYFYSKPLLPEQVVSYLQKT